MHPKSDMKKRGGTRGVPPEPSGLRWGTIRIAAKQNKTKVIEWKKVVRTLYNCFGLFESVLLGLTWIVCVWLCGWLFNLLDTSWLNLFRIKLLEFVKLCLTLKQLCTNFVLVMKIYQFIRAIFFISLVLYLYELVILSLVNIF